MDVIIQRTFKRAGQKYLRDRRASFTDNTARDLISRGLARPMDPLAPDVQALGKSEEGRPGKSEPATPSTSSSSSPPVPRSRPKTSKSSKSGAKKKTAPKDAE